MLRALYTRGRVGARLGSTNWRHEDALPPVVQQTFENKAPKNSPLMKITVTPANEVCVKIKEQTKKQTKEQIKKQIKKQRKKETEKETKKERKKHILKQIEKETKKQTKRESKISKIQNNFHIVESFTAKTVPNNAVLMYEEELYQMLADNLDNSDPYKRMLMVQNVMTFLPFRKHYGDMFATVNAHQHNRIILSGSRKCGKTLTAYAFLLDSLQTPDCGLVIPALKLAKWIQDTHKAEAKINKAGEADLPTVNVEFLDQFARYNSYKNKDLMENTTLLEDERWNKQLYSFKGDSLLNVARFGIQNPLLAGEVIRVILSTLLERRVPTQVVADNANLLCEIHSSMLAYNRNESEESPWWEQPPPDPNNITLLKHLKNFILHHELGNVVLTLDQRNSISARVIAETSNNVPHKHIVVPDVPSQSEYLAYLNIMRKIGFISRDMDQGEVTELTFLTGRNYIDTYKMVSML